MDRQVVRRAIVGGPKTGKTTSYPAARHADDLLPGRSWSEHSQAVSRLFDDPHPGLTVEGAAVARALRKWLAAHATGKPVDEVIVLEHPHAPLTEPQRIQTQGIATVLRDIEPELRRRGVTIRRTGQ